MKVEIVVLCLLATEHQRLPTNYQKLRREKERCPYRLQRDHGDAYELILVF